jgi:Surface glycan-binding protein B xyloglucan binding domain/IPT/TIG domain
MKKIVKNKFSLIGLLAILSVTAFIACQKDIIATSPEPAACGAAPTMSSVGTPTNRDTSLKEAKMTDWIIIKGANLCTPTSILVNDVAITVSEASARGNEVTFKIPKALPKTVNNKITFTNAAGTATIDLKVAVPNLTVTGYGGDIEEYTPIGQTLVIKGTNFDLYGFTADATTVSFGSASVKPIAVTASEIWATIPVGTAVNTIIKVKTPTIEKEVPIRYKDTRGMIFNFDPFGGWTPTVLSSGPTPSAVSNNYAVMTAQYTAGWGWQENLHAANNVKLADLGITAGAVDRYVVKFEINVPTDWTSNPLRIWWKSKSGTFGYNFPWGNSFNGATYKTAGWKTVTIPLADFYYSEDDAGAKKGQKVTTLDALSLDQGIETRLLIHGPDAKKMNLFVDNLRIIPKY